MVWRYGNPVQIEFGVDSFARLPDLIGKRRYALVTYGEPFFDGLASGLENLASEPNDVSYKAYDHTAKIEDRMQEYLTWEIDLMKQIERDSDVRFRAFPEVSQVKTTLNAEDAEAAEVRRGKSIKMQITGT